MVPVLSHDDMLRKVATFANDFVYS
jgi:hypothetical protein